MDYSIHRVPGCLSLRQNWLPGPLTRKRVLPPPPVGSGGEGERGRGGADSDEGTNSLVLYRYRIIHDPPIRCIPNRRISSCKNSKKILLLSFNRFLAYANMTVCVSMYESM